MPFSKFHNKQIFQSLTNRAKLVLTKVDLTIGTDLTSVKRPQVTFNQEHFCEARYANLLYINLGAVMINKRKILTSKTKS